MGKDTTVREALVSQALEEIDALITRVETLEEVATRLDSASAQYQQAVQGFNESAKKELHNYAQQTAHKVGGEVTTVLSQELEKAAAESLKNVLQTHSKKMLDTLNSVIREMQRTKKIRLLEIGLAAVLSSGVTAAILTFIH